MEQVKTAEYIKPCRRCGGTDRYAPNKATKGKWGKCKACMADYNSRRPTKKALRLAAVKNPRLKAQIDSLVQMTSEELKQHLKQNPF